MPKALLLVRASGIYARFLLPNDIQAIVGRRFLVRSLRDFRHDAARLVAARMGYALWQLIDAHRAGTLPMTKQLIDDVLRAHAAGGLGKAYEVTQFPGGGVSVKADTADDHRMAMEMIGRIQMIDPPRFSSLTVEPTGPMLHASIDRFLSQFKKRGRAAATVVETEHTLNLFRDLVDDRPVSKLSNDLLDAFRDDLNCWPARARVSARFKNSSAREIVDAGREDPNLPKLEVRTLEKHLDRLRVFFNDLVQRDEIRRNPLSGVSLQTTDAKYTETYRGFNPGELLRLFDPKQRSIYADGTPMFYWVPLIALMTGARLNEIAGLETDDLLVEGDHWGIRVVRNATRRIKNSNSKHFIPLPDRILDLGIVEYAKRIRAMGHKELFPGGSEKSKNGRGDQLSKHFGRTYLKACSVLDPDVCFHSFRHTFISRCDSIGITEAQMGKVTGHAPRSVISKYYIDPRTIPERKATVDKVSDTYVLPEISAYKQEQFLRFFLDFDFRQRRADARVARAARHKRMK